MKNVSLVNGDEAFFIKSFSIDQFLSPSSSVISRSSGNRIERRKRRKKNFVSFCSFSSRIRAGSNHLPDVCHSYRTRKSVPIPFESDDPTTIFERCKRDLPLRDEKNVRRSLYSTTFFYASFTWECLLWWPSISRPSFQKFLRTMMMTTTMSKRQSTDDGSKRKIQYDERWKNRMATYLSSPL